VKRSLFFVNLLEPISKLTFCNKVDRPAKAVIQKSLKTPDSCLHGNDKKSFADKETIFWDRF
jgi:hypothetical protein